MANAVGIGRITAVIVRQIVDPTLHSIGAGGYSST